MMKIENLRHFSDILTVVPIRRVARGARFRRSVDRNLFRSPQGGAIPRVFIAILRYVDPCPGLSCHARRPRPAECRPKCISVTARGAQFPGVFNLVHRFNLCENCYVPLYRASRGAEALGQARRSPHARAIPDYFSKTISPRPGEAKPACAERELQR